MSRVFPVCAFAAGKAAGEARRPFDARVGSLVEINDDAGSTKGTKSRRVHCGKVTRHPFFLVIGTMNNSARYEELLYCSGEAAAAAAAADDDDK